MKKTLAMILCLVLCAALFAGCGSTAEAPSAEPAADGAADAAPADTAEQSFTIKIAGIKADEDPASQAMQVFADEVNSCLLYTSDAADE